MLVRTVSNRANTAGVSPWFLTLASAGLFPASTVQLPLRTKGCGTPLDVAQLVASEFSDRPLALVSKHDPSIETSSFASPQPDLTWWLLRDQGFEAIAQDQMAWMVLVTILSILLVFAAIMVAAMAMRMVARLCLQRIAKNLQPLTKRHSMVHVGWGWSLRAQICAQFRNDWTEKEGNIKKEGKIAASVLSRRVSALSYCLEQWKPVQLQRCNSLAKTFSATPERSRDSRHDNQHSAFGTLTEKVEKMCNKLPLAVILRTIPCINAEVTCKLEDFVKYVHGETVSDQAELSIFQAIAQALDDNDSDVRREATEVLGRFLAKELKSLVALHDPNSEVKQNAAARLRELFASDRSLVCVLVAHIAESGSWRVRNAAVGSLGEILDSFAETEESRVLNSLEGDGTLDQAELSIVQAITQALDDGDHDVQKKATEVLGRFLAKKLKSLVALHDPNSKVKQNAAARLRELFASDRSLVCVLVAHIAESGSWPVRNAAVGSLGEILDSFAETEESRVLNSLEGDGTLDQAELSIVQAITQALDDGGLDVQKKATEVLGRFLAKKLKSLVALHDPNSKVKQNAAARLRELLASDRSLVCVLVARVTESGSWSVRNATVGSLGELLDSFAETEESRVLNSLEGDGTLDQAELSIVQAITQALDDEDHNVQEKAAEVLCRFRAKKLKTLVALHDPNSEVKQNAAARLRELLASDRSLVCVLVAHIAESGSWHVRKAAVGSLGEILDFLAETEESRVLKSLEEDGTLDQAELSIVQAITQALDDEDHNVQEKAAEVLGRFLAKKLKSLVALHDPNSKVKQNAAARLRELLASDRSLVCVLVARVTESGSWSVRYAAVGSLGELLDFLAETEESRVLKSLEEDGTLDQAELSIVQAITQALDDGDHDVQKKATEVLCRFLAKKLKSLVALHDPNSEVKQNAAARLRELLASDRSLVCVLVAHIAESGSWRVRNAAVGSLGELLDSFAEAEESRVLNSLEGNGTLDQAELSIVQAITQALDDGGLEVQEKAAEVLCRFLAKKLKSLVALHDPNSEVKQNAAARLRELLASDRSLVCVLVAHVAESGSWHVRNAAVGSLGELLDSFAETEESRVLNSLEGNGTLEKAALSIVQAITQALDDEDHNVQEKAAEVLCRFLAKKLKSLVALHDPNSEVKQHAGAQLRELFASDRSLVAARSDQAAQDSIGKLLAGADRNAFSAADFRSAVEELVECVVDKLCNCSLQHAPTAKLAMIDILSSRITLTRTGDARKQLAASKLTMMLKDIDPDVKRKCAVALCKQGMPWATPAISVLLRLLPQAVDVLRSGEEIEALAHVMSWAQTKDQLRIVTLFLDFVAHQPSKRLHKADEFAIPILQRVHDLGLEGVRQAGKSAIPILLTFLEAGSPEQQLAAAEGLQIIAKDLKPDSAVALIEDILLGPQSGLCPRIDTKVEPFPVKNWILSAVKSAQCLIADLPSPWTLVSGAAAFVLFSSQDPLAELLNHPHVLVRSHNHMQWGFSCCVPHISGLQRQISLRYSWQAYLEWFRKPLVDKFRSLTRGQKSVEQVLSLDEEQRLCDALQAFQLVTRFEVVPKSDLSGPALASVFARFGLKVFRHVGEDGVALLTFASKGSRPTLINVEAIERVVQRGFFPEQFHLLSPVVPVLRPSWLLVDFAVVIIQVACCISCIAMPLAFFTVYELARVPFYPKSPVDSLTEIHFGQRFPQLSERLLLASPVLTCTLAAYAAAVFASLIFAYCTEILPLAPLPILQALLRKKAADPVLHQSARSNRINPTQSGVGHGIFATTMKSIAWFAFFLSFAQITGALALLAFWLGFGVVVEPERFIPVVSALLSFMFAVAGRLRSLMNWRRSLAEGIQEILQSCAAVLWVSLMERMNISVSAQSASYQRLVQGIASDMDLFDLLLDGQETQLLASSHVCCFLAPIIDQVTFKMLLNNVQNLQERDCV